MYELEQSNRRNIIFQYHDNSRQREEKTENSVDQEKFKNTDQMNPSIKKYDMHIRKPPVVSSVS